MSKSISEQQATRLAIRAMGLTYQRPLRSIKVQTWCLTQDEYATDLSMHRIIPSLGMIVGIARWLSFRQTFSWRRTTTLQRCK